MSGLSQMLQDEWINVLLLWFNVGAWLKYYKIKSGKYYYYNSMGILAQMLQDEEINVI